MTEFSYGAALLEAMHPLGFGTEGTLSSAELEAVGVQLDALAAELEETEREMLLPTAQSWGLERVEDYLGRSPEATSLTRRRESLAALLRIGAQSATVQGINDTLSGCGLVARARETDTAGQVEVYFPQVPGEPEGMTGLNRIIRSIIPAHLLIHYYFWKITWEMLQAKFSTWQELEDGAYSFEEIEKLVLEEE